MICIDISNTKGNHEAPPAMRLDRFDLNLLVVLDALLEERNVTRAAQRVHIGQSAASAALARLRDYFDDALLVPVGRQLQPTPLAQSLVEPVRDALLRARAAIARKPGFDPATAERRFAICASDYATTVLLAQAVRHVAALAPGLALDIRSPPRDVLDAFDRGAIDLLVMPEQYASRLNHPQQRLFEDSQVCLVWDGHTTVGDSLGFDEYMNLGHVAVRFGDERSIAFEDWFLPRYGRQRRVECSVDNFGTLPLLVLGTQRVVTVHRRLALHFASTLPLRILQPPFDMPPLVEVLAWPRHLEHDPAHAWLRGQVLALAAGMDDGMNGGMNGG
jgi:DNA-binding transcriptional LysR family regulator